MYDGVGRRQDARTGQFLNIGQHSLNGRERNVLFRGNGDGTFVDVAWVNAADRVEDGRGLSVLDADGDGREDLLIRNFRQPAVLLTNRGGAGHRLEVVLVGVRSNRDAVGARLRLRTSAGWQTREVHAGSGYLSGQHLVQHFGLGAATRAETLEIAWPSGARTVLGPLAADRRYAVVEGVDDPPVGRPLRDHRPPAPAQAVAGAASRTVFTRLRSDLLQSLATHAE